MHHYLGSGLPNVWLADGYHVKVTEHGEAVAIEDVSGLQEVIGNFVATKTSPMTGAEFRYLRKELGLSQENLAAIIDKSPQAIALWEKTNRVPMIADRFMRGLYLEATTGKSGIMDQIETINRRDREQHELALTFDRGWRVTKSA